MKDDGLILAAWAEARREGSAAVLATVVKVSGSSYRGPGARMLITETGARTGSISGGCLEGDVVKKAWWLTDGGSASSKPGAVLRVYDNTSDDDAVWTFGLGCNGVVHVLLERLAAGTNPLAIELLAACRDAHTGGLLATVISGDATGEKLAIFPDGSERSEVTQRSMALEIAEDARLFQESRSSEVRMYGDTEVFLEYVAPPVRLLIVGAGHDALPVVRLAKELGWHVTVVDGRSNQARAERFPEADGVMAVDLEDPLRGLALDEQTAAVVMSHSYEQDRAFLGALHPLGLRYFGVLGPRKRTERMLGELGAEGRGELHSPVGLDIGADTPEEIALAIVSEIQASFTGHAGGMLVRKPGPIHARTPARRPVEA